jgi:hypothetical protein
VLELPSLSRRLRKSSAYPPPLPWRWPPLGRRRRRSGQEAEQTEFDVVLDAIGDNKINVIKVVKELTGPWPEGSKGTG